MDTVLTGVRGVDHIGVTVPDLEAAHDFFVRVLGCEYLYRLGPFQDSGHWMSEHLGVDDSTVMRQLRFYRLGGQAIFEVFEYVAADQNAVPPRNSDVGGHHVALYVDDLDRPGPRCWPRASRSSASPRPAAVRARASAGSTSWHRGACSSS